MVYELFVRYLAILDFDTRWLEVSILVLLFWELLLSCLTGLLRAWPPFWIVTLFTIIVSSIQTSRIMFDPAFTTMVKSLLFFNITAISWLQSSFRLRHWRTSHTYKSHCDTFFRNPVNTITKSRKIDCKNATLRLFCNPIFWNPVNTIEKSWKKIVKMFI